MQIAFLVYEGLTALDIIGPYEVFAGIPEADAQSVSRRAGEVSVDTGAFALRTEHAMAHVPRPDLFVVPGGSAATFRAAERKEILQWMRQAHAHSTYTASVCAHTDAPRWKFRHPNAAKSTRYAGPSQGALHNRHHQTWRKHSSNILCASKQVCTIDGARAHLSPRPASPPHQRRRAWRLRRRYGRHNQGWRAILGNL